MVKITPQAPVRQSSVARIEIRDRRGHVVVVPPGFDADELAAVLEVLDQC